MIMKLKLFKLYVRIYYNFLLGKINNSIPKLNINSLIPSNSPIQSIIIPGNEKVISTMDHLIENYPMRGLQGAVGTQLDQMVLLKGNKKKVQDLDRYTA